MDEGGIFTHLLTYEASALGFWRCNFQLIKVHCLLLKFFLSLGFSKQKALQRGVTYSELK